MRFWGGAYVHYGAHAATAPHAIAGISRSQWRVGWMTYLVLLCVWTYHITDSPISSDDMGTAVPAVHLRHHGIVALKEPSLPTMYREPLPIITTAVAVAVADVFYGRAPAREYLEGKRARLLKLQNLFWLTLLCFACFYVAFRLTSSFAFSIAAAVLSHAIFLAPIGRGPAVNTLYTEIPAAALLVPASWYCAIGLVQRDKRALAIAGVLCGLTALVKASLLYIVVGLVLVIATFGLLRRRSGSMRTSVAELAVLALTFVVVVAPWMYRNWVQFGTIGIAERGGLALYFRALYNDADAAEYKGLFYVWAPGPLAPLVARMLHISPRDLEPGGPLFRLNREPKWERINTAAERAGRPELATSIFGEARAERVKARKTFAAAGFGQRTDIAADNYLRDRALDKMRERPLRALALTFPVLWRGATLIAPLFVFIAVHALLRRRYVLLGFCLPAAGLAAFYAVFTMFELRYGVPTTVVAILGACVAAHGELVQVGVHPRWRSAYVYLTRWPRLRASVLLPQVLGNSLYGKKVKVLSENVISSDEVTK